MKKNRWIFNRKVIISLFIIIFVFQIPFKLTISPIRAFVIKGSGGQPIQNALVKQVWYQYALGYTNEDEIRSDGSGKVYFPARTIKTNLLTLIYKRILKVINYKLHASVGSSDTIGILIDGRESEWIYDGVGIRSGVYQIDDIAFRRKSNILKI